MGPEKESWGVGLGRLIHAAQIAGLVNANQHACGLHPFLDELMAALHCRRKEGALDRSVLIRACTECGTATKHCLCQLTFNAGWLRCIRRGGLQSPLRTHAVIDPWGSSVGTKIWFGLSWPKGERSTRLQCLFGMDNCTSLISLAAPSAASAIA